MPLRIVQAPVGQALKDKKIGEVLVHTGHLAPEQLQPALAAARENHEKLGRFLIRSGLITPALLCQSLALQSGLPMVDLTDADLAPELGQIFPYTALKTHNCVPFEASETLICLAVAQPLKPRAVRELETAGGRGLQMFIAQEDLVAKQLDRIYRGRIPRRFTRYAVPLSVQYQFCTRLGRLLEPSVFGGLTENVSQGGFAVSATAGLPKAVEELRRQDVYLNLLSRQSTGDLRALCQLRWWRKREGHGAPAWGMGLEIVEISPDDQQRLQDLCIMAAQGKAPPPARRAETPQPPVVLQSAPRAVAAAELSTKTETLGGSGTHEAIGAEKIRWQVRALGLLEDVVIHEQVYARFLQEQGIRELGRGGEGAVYFLRGHVVKVSGPETAAAALREIVHMLHLNPILRGGAMGERGRQDLPALLWTYTLSNGSLAIGMKPFDPTERSGGATLHARLHYGPRLSSDQALRMLRSVADTLAYMHTRGILHHDLKPSNIFVPADLQQPPVVFDLSQSLWKRDGWGRDWLRHEHNANYWYNGTYRYMHLQRRLAHLGALATLNRQTPPPGQAQALQEHLPSFYDDVFAFARIVRDCLRSRNVLLAERQKAALHRFYWDLMGLDKNARPAKEDKPVGMGRLTYILRRAAAKPAETRPTPERKWPSMDRVVIALRKVIG